MKTRKTLNPSGLFDSLQHGFSQGLIAEGSRRLHLSGQVGVDAMAATVPGGMTGQTAKALDNIALLMVEAGGTMADIVMLRIYIAETGRDDLAAIADALKACFPTDPPPSSWVIVTALARPEWLIEIEAEAVL